MVKRLCKDYEKSFAKHPNSKYWCYELNNGLRPQDVFLNCNKKFWFKCNICEHKFNSSLLNISNNQWCPYCTNQKLCKT